MKTMLFLILFVSAIAWADAFDDARRQVGGDSYSAQQVGDTTYIRQDQGYGNPVKTTSCQQVGDTTYCH